MTAELILGVTATVFVIVGAIITYCVGPVRRSPFIVDLLNATFGRSSPRRSAENDPPIPRRSNRPAGNRPGLPA